MTATTDVRADRPADGVLRITIDRPTKRNALGPAAVAALDRLSAEALADPTVRAVVITGAGGVFSAGADLGVFASGGAAAADLVRRGNDTVARLTASRKPVVAAVDGPALGGGFEVALACAVRVATDRAVFGLPEVTLGLLPAWGGVPNLSRVCGPALALELALTGRTLPAAEALRVGAVHQVVPVAELAGVTVGLAVRLAGWSPAAVAGILELAGGAGRAREVDLFEAALARPEAAAALARFRPKRAA
jgi:enoyl-CoA hydratase/carnithine racemase